MSRSSSGVFVSGQRSRRKLRAPNFAVIEEASCEPATCGELSRCVAIFLCAAHGGTQCRQWLLRVPVFGWSDDAVNLTTNLTVRAALSMPAHEVYVRSLGHLVPSAFLTSTAAYSAVRFSWSLRTEHADVAGAGPSLSSFRDVADGQSLGDDDIKGILRSASSSLRAAKNKIPRGHVFVVERSDAWRDPVLLSAVRRTRRKRSVRAAADYRSKGAALMRERMTSLRGVLGAGAIARVRRHLELEDGVAGSRATRLRVARGLSQMRLLPSREQLRQQRPEYIDARGRVAHYLLNKSSWLRWDYIVGKGSEGIRQYHI